MDNRASLELANSHCLNNNDENYRRKDDKYIERVEEIYEQANSLRKETKDKSIDSIDTFDSESSVDINNYQPDLRYLDITNDSNYTSLNNNHLTHSYRKAGSSGIGSEQSTSYESSEAEESTTEDQNTCDERSKLKECLDSSDSSYSDDSQLEEHLRTIKKFTKHFVNNIFENR